MSVLVGVGRSSVGWGVADGSWMGVLVGVAVGHSSVGRPGGVGDGWGVADGPETGVEVCVGNSSVGCGEVGDGRGVGVVGTGVKVRVGTV
jgi:hypothetical protein